MKNRVVCILSYTKKGEDNENRDSGNRMREMQETV